MSELGEDGKSWPKYIACNGTYRLWDGVGVGGEGWDGGGGLTVGEGGGGSRLT